MHEVIRTNFQDTTVIEVAHKLDSILDFDRVVLMEQGRVVECDAPKKLLSQQSAFAALYQSRK